MKERIKKHKYSIVAVIVFLVIIIPLAIHCLFKIHPSMPFFAAEWDAGDLLQFYGTLLAASGAIIGVGLTIWYSLSNYNDDTRKRVLPFLVITPLKGVSRFNLLADYYQRIANKDMIDGEPEEADSAEENKEPVYEEHKRERTYYVIDNGIKKYERLPEEYLSLLEKRGFVNEYDNNGVEVVKHIPFISMPMLIENVGNGPAVNLRIGFNKTETVQLYSESIHLKAGDSHYLHLFTKDFGSKDGDIYILSFVYHDIYDNYYSQEFKVCLTDEQMSISREAKQVKQEVTHG